MRGLSGNVRAVKSNASLIWLNESRHEREQGCFTRSVWTDNTNHAARRQGKTQIINQQGITKAFFYIFTLDNNIAKTRTRWNINFKTARLLLTVLRQQRLIGTDAGF